MVRANSFDLLQADHTLSGIDIALWDLLGQKLAEPVYRLLGFRRPYPKLAYASQLFGDDPQSTFRKAQQVVRSGYRAAKFGWGAYGRGTVEADAEQAQAAREGLGKDCLLMVDAGTVWCEDVEKAAQRLPALQACGVCWLEEPFVSGALESYRILAQRGGGVKLAGGEGCHNYHQAKNMIDYAALGFAQIDAGRIGGITVAKQVADYAEAKGVRFVNHTFTTHLALSASLQPYAGLEAHELCEYPTEPSSLAQELTQSKLLPDAAGRIGLPEKPGLGIAPDEQAIKKYLVEVEMRVGGRTIFQSLAPSPPNQTGDILEKAFTVRE